MKSSPAKPGATADWRFSFFSAGAAGGMEGENQ